MNLPETGSQITLEDYILSQSNGTEKDFQTCSDVLTFPEANVLASEYYFYRRYSIECYGAQKFLEGEMSKDNFFLSSLKDIISELPAIVAPETGETSMQKNLKGKKLIHSFDGMTPIENSSTSVSVVIENADVEYDILGRKDLNGDGHEDLILMMTYHIIEASGRGTALFALSKTSESDDIQVLWKYK